MKIPVFFNPLMVSQVVLSSPSPRKPLEVINEWNQKYNNHIEIKDFLPFEQEEFYIVHEKSHVDKIFKLKKYNGFDTKHKEIAQSLYWTSASFYYAAVQALEKGIWEEVPGRSCIQRIRLQCDRALLRPRAIY